MQNKITIKIALRNRLLGVFFLGCIIFPFITLEANAQTSEEYFLTLKIKDFSKGVLRSEYLNWTTTSSHLATDNSYLSEIERGPKCEEDEFFCLLHEPARSSLHSKLISSNSFDREKVRVFLEKLAQEADRPAINAKFQMEGERVSTFAKEENGYELDIDNSLEKLSSSVDFDLLEKGKLEIDLPYKELFPEITSSSINGLGIDTLIGQGKSNFKGSPKSRIHNIKVATQQYQGLLIAPGEEFSFVKILGQVDGEHGYLPELVIKKDKTEPEFGGGICQVSTTAFRAAIYSGLEITARRNHAYPVQYYDPQGMDATVYVPKPDLKFKNNTPGHILIQTEIVGTELTFSFFGTSDGRRVEIDGPHITEKNADGSMKTTFTQKVYDKDGNVFINDTFNSSYDSPSKYPHPGQEKITEKPEDWSKKQWDEYKKANGL